MGKLLRMSALGALFLGSGTAFADFSGNRNILEIGCHVDTSVCYVTVDGPAAGGTNCVGNSFRWSGADPAGKAILSLLNGAFLAGKPVNFYLSGCLAAQMNEPTFAYIVIGK